MFGDRSKRQKDGKSKKKAHKPSVTIQPVASALDLATHKPMLPRFRPQQQVPFYGIPHAAATTANIPLQRPQSLPIHPYPVSQPNRGLDGALIAQGSRLYHASVDAAGGMLAASEDTIYDILSSRLDAVITAIDEETFSGEDKDLGRYLGIPSP